MPRGFGQTTAAMADPGGHGAFPNAVSAPGYAVLECEFDTGGRFTVWGSSDSHRPLPPIRRKGNALRFGGRVSGGERAVWTVAGATPRPEGSVRARGQVCLHTPAPGPPGVAPATTIPPGRGFGTASKAADQPLAGLSPPVTLSASPGKPDAPIPRAASWPRRSDYRSRTTFSGSFNPDTPEARSTRRCRCSEGLKTGTSRGGTSTGSPVLGMWPVRALRCRTSKVPKPAVLLDGVTAALTTAPTSCPERKHMMRIWADYLDRLRAGEVEPGTLRAQGQTHRPAA